MREVRKWFARVNIIFTTKFVMTMVWHDSTRHDAFVLNMPRKSFFLNYSYLNEFFFHPTSHAMMLYEGSSNKPQKRNKPNNVPKKYPCNCKYDWNSGRDQVDVGCVHNYYVFIQFLNQNEFDSLNLSTPIP